MKQLFWSVVVVMSVVTAVSLLSSSELKQQQTEQQSVTVCETQLPTRRELENQYHVKKIFFDLQKKQLNKLRAEQLNRLWIWQHTEMDRLKNNALTDYQFNDLAYRLNSKYQLLIDRVNADIDRQIGH